MPPAVNNRRRQRQLPLRLPLFARSHPFIYHLFIVSARFTTPLTFLTLASTSTFLQRKLSALQPSNSSAGSKAYSTGFKSLMSLAAEIRWNSNLSTNWKRLTIWLWYASVWSFMARYALVGTSVFWVLRGWEEERGVVERDY